MIKNRIYEKGISHRILKLTLGTPTKLKQVTYSLKLQNSIQHTILISMKTLTVDRGEVSSVKDILKLSLLSNKVTLAANCTTFSVLCFVLRFCHFSTSNNNFVVS